MSDSYINKLLMALIVISILGVLLPIKILSGIVFGVLLPLILVYLMYLWLPARISRKEKEEANNPYTRDGDKSER